MGFDSIHTRFNFEIEMQAAPFDKLLNDTNISLIHNELLPLIIYLAKDEKMCEQIVSRIRQENRLLSADMFNQGKSAMKKEIEEKK